MMRKTIVVLVAGLVIVAFLVGTCILILASQTNIVTQSKTTLEGKNVQIIEGRVVNVQIIEGRVVGILHDTYMFDPYDGSGRNEKLGHYNKPITKLYFSDGSTIWLVGHIYLVYTNYKLTISSSPMLEGVTSAEYLAEPAYELISAKKIPFEFKIPSLP